VALFITSASLSTIFAQENGAKLNKINSRIELAQQKTVEATEKKVEAIQNRVTLKKDNAIKEIDRRIASLEKLIEKNG
jgi:L-lactate utilization protein LutB